MSDIYVEVTVEPPVPAETINVEISERRSNVIAESIGLAQAYFTGTQTLATGSAYAQTTPAISLSFTNPRDYEVAVQASFQGLTQHAASSSFLYLQILIDGVAVQPVYRSEKGINSENFSAFSLDAITTFAAFQTRTFSLAGYSSVATGYTENVQTRAFIIGPTVNGEGAHAFEGLTPSVADFAAQLTTGLA